MSGCPRIPRNQVSSNLIEVITPDRLILKERTDESNFQTLHFIQILTVIILGSSPESTEGWPVPSGPLATVICDTMRRRTTRYLTTRGGQETK